MLTKERLKKAVDRNVIVYDEDAEPNILTHKLVGIMIDYFKQQYGEDPHTLYFPYDIYLEVGYPTFCGLTPCRVKDLRKDGVLYRFLFGELNIGSKGKYICVITSDNYELLGSF